MNGTDRLYRSKSDSVLGGVAAGLGNYFKVDPTFIRLGFVVATFFSGGMFLLLYAAMWLLVPTVGSAATEPGKIVSENLNEIGDRMRGFVGGPSGGHSSGNASPATGPDATYNQGQLPPAIAAASTHQGFNPKVLILIGGFFLLLNMGIFRGFHMGSWWPLILIGLGVMMLSRRRP